ncbi:optineurin-like isoform X2 [Centruroides vittatus]|uniref:optineurin-like isoform X2 n=1 Tax=Centruroides vittatus TaxID=120091 RepID=UPI00350EFFD7
MENFTTSLEKTNLKAKQQFQTLQMCEEQFTKRCEKYESIIEDNQKQKLKVMQENENLKVSIEELKTALAIAVNDGKGLQFKTKIDEMSLEINELKKGNEEKQKELEKLNSLNLELEQKHTVLQTNIEKLEKMVQHLETEKKALIVMNAELEKKVSKNEREKTSLQLNTEDYSLIQNISEFSDLQKSEGNVSNSVSSELITSESGKQVPSLMMHEHQTKVSQLNQLLAEKQLEVSKLQLSIEQKENEITSLKQMQMQSLPLEHQQLSLANELKVSEEKFQLVAISAQKYKERCDSLQHWLQVYQEKLESVRLNDTAVIEQLQIEITTLRHMLAEEQAAKLEDKKNLEEARQQFEHLLTEYKKDELEAWKQIESRRHQEELDKVTAVVVDKNEEISKLKEEIDSLKTKIENIPILEAQAQLYKQDFEDESKAKVNALKEVEKLKADLQIMYTAREKLSEELNKVSHSGRHRRRHDHEKRTNADEEKPLNENSNKYECPKCNMVFTEFQPLSNHVEMCITDNLFDYP